MKYSLATGNWGQNKAGQVQKTGVAQVLQRLTFMSYLSHLRRLNTPLEKLVKSLNQDNYIILIGVCYVQLKPQRVSHVD